MPTERVTLDLDATGLYAARFAAAERNQSLDEWVSAMVRTHAIDEAMQSRVEQERPSLDEPPGWADDIMDRIFGDDEA